MIAYLTKKLRMNAGLSIKEAAFMWYTEELTYQKYEDGKLIPKMNDLIIFSIKTDQEIETMVKAEIKAYLKSKEYLYLNGTITGLELIHFDFVDQDISFSLVEKWMELKFSISEISYLINITKEKIRDEIKDVIEEKINLDDNHQFISWNKYAYLVEKYCY